MENSKKLGDIVLQYLNYSSKVREQEDVSFNFETSVIFCREFSLSSKKPSYNHSSIKKAYISREIGKDTLFEELIKEITSTCSLGNEATVELKTLEKNLNDNLRKQIGLQKRLNIDSEDIIFEIESIIKQMKKEKITIRLNNEIRHYKDKLFKVKDLFSKVEESVLSQKSFKRDVENDNINFDKDPLFSDALEGFNILEEMGIFKEENIFDFTRLESYIDNINRLNKDLLDEFIKAKYKGMQSDKFIQQIKDNGENIANNLAILENIQEEGFFFDDYYNRVNKTIVIKLEDSVYKDVVNFKDKSLLVIDKKDKLTNILSQSEIEKIFHQVLKEDINKEFYKNPFHAKTILSYIENNKKSVQGYLFNYLTSFIESFKNNIDILKLYKFDLKKEFSNLTHDNESDYRVFEHLDDHVNKIVRKHKIKQFAESIASNKYQHLYNNETYILCGELLEMKVNQSKFQEYMGKKIAAYNTPEQFNEGLKKLINSFNNFIPDTIKEKAENSGSELFYEKENLIILQIKTFEQSKFLGSSSWCISRDAYYFDSYSKDRDQYFIYDFSKESTNVESMIGITLNSKGEHFASHYKDDEKAYVKDIGHYIDLINNIKNKKDIIIKNDFKI